MASDLVCRACLCSNVNFTIINDIVRIGFEELAGILVKPDDTFPQTICSNCLKLITQFLEFRKKVLSSNEYLLEEYIKLKDTKEGTVSWVCVKREPSTSPGCDTGVNGSYEGHYQVYNVLQESNIATAKEYKRKKRIVKKTKDHKPRTVIEVDPEKIAIVNLSIEEQIKCQELEKNKPQFVEMPFKCMKCYKGFNFERKLNTHIDSYHKPNSEYVCSICTRTVGTYASYALHQQRHAVRYECRVCGAQFQQKVQAVDHYRTAHEGIVPELACSICGKVFRHRSTLKGHKRNQHSTERVTCDVCKKDFKCKDILLEHMLLHTGEKNFSCPLCPKRFRLKSQVTAHRRAHSADRPHYCAPCDVQFKSLNSLKTHIRNTRNHGHQGTHVCSECGKSYTTAGSLRKHAAVHAAADGGGRAGGASRGRRAPTKNYVCHECGYRFTARKSLLLHLMIHTGEKPHSCDECGATFRQVSTLQTHTKLVHLKLKRKKQPKQPNDRCVLVNQI